MTKTITRYKASASHLGLSLLVVGSVFLIIFLIWYPSPYFKIMGAKEIILVVIGVDLGIGPLLTLIVYKQGKRGLHFDISVILLVQLIALFYGTKVIYDAKPESMVFAVDRFNIISKKEVYWEEFDQKSIPGRPLIGPAVYYADFPTDETEQQTFLDETVIEGKPDLEYRPRYWQPLSSNLDQLLRKTRSIKYLLDKRPEHKEKIIHFIESDGLDVELLNFSGVIGKNGDFSIIFNRETGHIEGAIEIDPWMY
ncbi:MAG: hypothetical protein ACI9H8_000858 [Lysobacterales bacterium]|jgi:hypothetical protein